MGEGKGGDKAFLVAVGYLGCLAGALLAVGARRLASVLGILAVILCIPYLVMEQIEGPRE